MALAHHSLVAWQRPDDLFIKLHQLSLQAFPGFEKFELGSQLRRAAFSVAVNIVEGFAKPQGRARVNFLNISQSSLAEVGYCIHVAQRLGYVSEIVAAELETEIKKAGCAAGGPHSIGTSSHRRKDRRRADRYGLLDDWTRVTISMSRGSTRRRSISRRRAKS